MKYTVYEKLIKKFKILGCKISELFKYWDKLILDLAAILSNLARPFQRVNWKSIWKLCSFRYLSTLPSIVWIANYVSKIFTDKFYKFAVRCIAWKRSDAPLIIPLENSTKIFPEAK